jgi:hypothetical protein
MFTQGNEIPNELIKFLAYNDLNLELVSNLPVESLELFLQDFQEYFGEKEYLICLLLDSRPEVRQLAITCIEDNEDKENDQQAPEAGEDDLQGDDTHEDNQQIKELKKLLGEARLEAGRARKRNKRLEEKIDKLKTNLSTQDDLITCQKEKTMHEQEVAASTQKKLDDLEKTLEQKIHEGITVEIRDRVCSWLAKPMELNDLVKEQDAGNLLDRVNNALEKQMRVDKHSGNLRVLRERLAELKQARKNINQARQESLSVIPELARLSNELENEISEIQMKIGSGSHDNTQLAAWVLKINEATTFRDLQDIDRLIKQLREQDIFSENDVLLLRKQIRTTRDQFIDQWRYVDNECLPCPTRQTLIVDGHNVVLGPDSFYLFNGRNTILTEQEKRKLLTDMNIKAFENKQDLTVLIYFDSPTYSQNIVTDNIEEIFSGGGQNDQRADNAIIDFLQQSQNEMSEQQYALITDDQGLASRAEQLGAGITSVFEYALMLRQYAD